MKKSFDDLKLLNAALADENWESCNARLRNEGLATLRSAKRMRQRLATAGQIAATVTVIAALWWGSHRISIRNRDLQFARNESPKVAMKGLQDKAGTYITEEQMLEMLPKGSCVLAEINGQRQLVIFED